MPLRLIRKAGVFLQEQILVVCVGVAAAWFAYSGRVSIARTPRIVDFDLLMVLFALLVSVELLRESNLFERIVAGTLHRFPHTRSFVAGMVVVTGAIAALLTNDVALFIVIPFTVLAGRASGFDVRSAVVLEIVAANLVGCLTPLGNPQNLFIYHQSGWGPVKFVGVMLPFVLWAAAGLLIAVPLVEPRGNIDREPAPPPPIDRLRAIAGGITFSLVVLEILRVAPAWPAAVAAAFALFALLPHRLGEIDLSIIPLFFFAFIVVEGLRTFSVYRLLLEHPLGTPETKVFVLSVTLSQAISNVPATILLEPLADGRWVHLLYGVNAGGCGTIIASLANLLGWRIYRRETEGDDGFFRRLTIVNFAFLAWMFPAGLLLAGWLA